MVAAGSACGLGAIKGGGVSYEGIFPGHRHSWALLQSSSALGWASDF